MQKVRETIIRMVKSNLLVILGCFVKVQCILKKKRQHKNINQAKQCLGKNKLTFFGQQIWTKKKNKGRHKQLHELIKIFIP